MTRRLIISLHDASPFHQARMEKAEALFAELGLSKVTYLLVPQYHGGYLASQDAAFIAWCRKARPFQARWHLHGYLHLETGAPAAAAPEPQREPGGKDAYPRPNPSAAQKSPSGNFGEGFKRKYMTAGEGEFLSLSASAIREKIQAGRDVFRACLGQAPQGFVAPAWLFNGDLLPELQRQGFAVTEDHRRIYRCDTRRSLPSPVITWATRTWLRKYGSLLVCPALARLWSRVPLLRIALHPFDFDHPETVASIRGVLRHALRGREQAFSEDLDFGSAG